MSRRTPTVLAALLGTVALALAGSGSAPSPSGEAPYIVLFEDSVDRPVAVAEDQIERHGGELGYVYRHALKGYSAVLPREEAERLRGDPRVIAVRPDHRVLPAAQTIPTGVNRIFATANAAFDIDEDDLRVDADVAVIDTGVDGELSDLPVAVRIDCSNGAEEPGECVTEGGVGNGHGTRVAGVVGALDNGEGTVGAAPGARIWSVNVHETAVEITEAQIVAGVDWVTGQAEDIEVANMSIACATLPCSLPTLDDAISASIEAGVVHVVAAGNNGGNAASSTFGTAPGAITVGAIADYDGLPGGGASVPVGCVNRGADDHRAGFSNHGLEVEIVAPGACIYSTNPGGTYGTGDGTSFASPQVAAAAAVLASQCNPDSRADVEFIADTVMAEGNSGEIAEGGWNDTAADGWKEPLLNISDEEVFDPVLLDPSNPELDEEPDPDGCEWRSHQAESDVDSDGRADLVTIDSDGDANVFAGEVDGYDTANPTVSLQGEVDPALGDGEGHYAIDTADVDGDRHADLITFTGGEGAYVHPGDGEGGFGAPIHSLQGQTLSFDGTGGTLEPIAVADVNGDERSDLVATAGNLVVTFPANANGTFGSPLFDGGLWLNSALMDGVGHYFLDVIDVTGEELNDTEAPIDYNDRATHADLVTMNSDGTVRVYKGKSDGRFQKTPISAATIDPIMDDGEGEEPVGLGDVDRDRRADLLTLDGETLKLYRGKADGTFAAASEPYEGGVDSSLMDTEGQELIGLLDYSRDGLSDLVSVTDEGQILTYTAQRDATFAAPVAGEGTVPSVRHGGQYEFLAEKPFLRRAGCEESDCIWTPPLHPPRFHSTSYPAELSGGGFGTFTTSVGAYACEESALQGELENASSQLDLNASYGKCLGAGAFSSAVDMNSCHYTLALQNAGPPYTGTLGVACSEEGDGIDFNAYLNKAHTILACRAKLLPQEGKAGLDLTTSGTGGERKVEIDAQVEGLEYAFTGACGGKSGVHTNGVISGETTLEGESEAELQLPVYLAGEESP
ncbi:MAG TPA: S8 family serine peptidase [Solirubrobacterales bacterium]|nr:S8 family serine peptidase [Solirubrobacterales bacterium]